MLIGGSESCYSSQLFIAKKNFYGHYFFMLHNKTSHIKPSSFYISVEPAVAHRLRVNAGLYRLMRICCAQFSPRLWCKEVQRPCFLLQVLGTMPRTSEGSFHTRTASTDPATQCTAFITTETYNTDFRYLYESTQDCSPIISVSFKSCFFPPLHCNTTASLFPLHK